MKQGYDELREIAEDTAEQIKSWADLLEKEDTNRRRYAESMTAERDKLRHEHGNLSDSVTYLDTVITDLREERDQLRGENNRLEAERDGLSARLKAALDARDYYCQDRDELLAERDEATNELSREIPRVITADELREGQVAAINLRDGSWFAGAVSGLNRVISDGSTATGPASGLDGYTIVLLADAPDEDVSGSDPTWKESGEKLPRHVTAEDIRNSAPGSTWKDKEGGVHEWTGEALRWRLTEGGLDGCPTQYRNRTGTQEKTMSDSARDQAERRGEVIAYEDIRLSDVVDIYYPNPRLDKTDQLVEVVTKGRHIRFGSSLWSLPNGDHPEYRLVHRPETYECPDCGDTVNRVEPPIGDYSLKTGDKITAERQLRDLPTVSAVVDEDGNIWQKGIDSEWLIPGEAGSVPSYALWEGTEHLTVTYIPEEGES